MEQLIVRFAVWIDVVVFEVYQVLLSFPSVRHRSSPEIIECVIITKCVQYDGQHCTGVKISVRRR